MVWSLIKPTSAVPSPIHPNGDEGCSDGFPRSEVKVQVTRLVSSSAKACPLNRDACMNADISIDSFPSSDFGVPKKVTRIGSDALERSPETTSDI